MTDTTRLQAAIDDLRPRLGALPDIRVADGELMEQHRRLRAAEDQLAAHLGRTWGARIRRGVDTNQVRMLGVTASGTSGVSGALTNWLAGAERRLARITQPAIGEG